MTPPLTGPALHVDEARAYAQGDLFLINGGTGSYEARVCNTSGPNICPAEEFEALDIDALRKETGYTCSRRIATGSG